MEKDRFHFRSKLVHFVNPNTNAYLDICLDSSLKSSDGWDDYCTTKFTLLIKDKRIQTSGATKIALELQHVYDLLRQFKKIFGEETKEDLGNAFKMSTSASIVKFLAKTKQTAIFTFRVADRKPIVNLCLMDPLFPNGKIEIDVDYSCFKIIKDLMKNYITNLISIDLNTKQILSNDLIISKLDEINKENDSRVDLINGLIRQQCTKIVGTIKETAIPVTTLPIIGTIEETITPNINIGAIKYEIEDIKTKEPEKNPSNTGDLLDEFSDDETPPSGDQMNFINELENTNFFEAVEIPKVPEEKPKQKPVNIKPKAQMTNQPFLATFLNFDISRLKEWTTSFIHTTEKSDPELFTPFDTIMRVTSIPKKELSIYSKEYGYYLIQYALIHTLKKAVKDNLETGIHFPVNSIPPIKFSTNIVPGTKLYNMTKEIITIILSYSLIINNAMKAIDKDKNNISRFIEYEKVWYATKLLFTPFIFSMELTDNLKEELLIEFRRCVSSGFFDSLKKEYKEITLGGDIKINLELFDMYIDKFISILRNVKATTFNTKETVSKYFIDNNIPIVVEPINNSKDIQTEIFSHMNKSQKGKKVVAKSTKKETKSVKNDADPSMTTFLKAVEKYVDKDVVDNIKKTCSSYKGLQTIFQTMDLPAEVFKVKRVMDLNPGVYDKVKILRMAKLLEEDQDVTESRVFQDDSVSEIETVSDVNIQDVINF